MGLDSEDLRDQIESMFDPEPDEDGSSPFVDIPHPRLESEHGLDLSYLQPFNGSDLSIRAHIRKAEHAWDDLAPIAKNLHVAANLIQAGLRLFGQSILAYHERSPRHGNFTYYPSVLLTVWSGFEAFVRSSSEILATTVPTLPDTIVRFLREEEEEVTSSGGLRRKRRNRPILDRYAILLRYGHEFNVNRGDPYWQALDKAKKLRDDFTHLRVTEPRRLHTSDVIDFVEAVLLGVIHPSAQFKRTQIVGVYSLYWLLDSLRGLASNYEEKPYFIDWEDSPGSRLVYAPFARVDPNLFPPIDDAVGDGADQPDLDEV